MKVRIDHPNEEVLDTLNVRKWPIWEKGVSRFDWHYDTTEECYFLEGRVIVETGDGEKYEIKKGDFVSFPSGLSCTWDIKEPVRKHYTFK
jgi:uncharacterized cupin superfamily protein